MAVAVKPSAGGLTFDPPIALFPFSHRNFDVAPGGQKFLLLQPADEDRGSTEMTVLLNWREALKGAR